MSLNDLANVAEILASLGVIASLIFVGIQMRQNIFVTQGMIRNQMCDADVALHTNSVGINSTSNLFKEELSDYEATELARYYTALVRTRENHWIQYQNGLLDERTLETYMGGLMVVLNTSRGRRYWDSISSMYDKNFSAKVDEYLQNKTGFDGLKNYITLLK